MIMRDTSLKSLDWAWSEMLYYVRELWTLRVIAHFLDMSVDFSEHADVMYRPTKGGRSRSLWSQADCHNENSARVPSEWNIIVHRLGKLMKKCETRSYIDKWGDRAGREGISEEKEALWKDDVRLQSYANVAA
jgi:hypothetical protein